MSKQVELVQSLRSLSVEELEDHLREQRRRLFEVRFQQAAGQVENHRQIRQLRREIARTMTIQIERSRGHELATEAEREVEHAVPEERPRRFRLRRGAAAGPAAAAETAVAEPEAPSEELAGATAELESPATGADGVTQEADGSAAEQAPAAKPRARASRARAKTSVPSAPAEDVEPVAASVSEASEMEAREMEAPDVEASEIEVPDVEAEVVHEAAPPDPQIDDQPAGGTDAEPDPDPEQESQP